MLRAETHETLPSAPPSIAEVYVRQSGFLLVRRRLGRLAAWTTYVASVCNSPAIAATGPRISIDAEPQFLRT
jgi:hypothetical protein